MSSVTIFKASAGSGKTFTLAVQYIRLLITQNPLEYRHTLAVTFTNKATAEMKDRILEQLYGIGRGLPSSKSYMDALKKELAKENLEISDEQIKERCRDALKYILHDYSRFRIETIDSFFQSVLRNLAHELGLNAKLQVDLNDKQILSQAVDNLVDGLGRDISAGKERIANREQKTGSDVMPWIDSYVKDQIENEDDWDVREKIKHLSSIIFKEEYMKRDDSFRQKINDEELIKQYRSNLNTLKQQAKAIMDEVAKNLSAALDHFSSTDCSKYGGDITKAVSRGAWVIKYVTAMKNGNYTSALLTDTQKKQLEDTSAMVKKSDLADQTLLLSIEPLRQAIEKAEQEREMYAVLANTIDLSLQHLSPLRLLNHIEEEVTAITNESNRFILAKTPILLSKLIEGSDAPFVFEKMGTLFNNVMIDEFQDTSRMQWDNFKVLLLESQSAGGQNLLVGDIKQSIYRFRNGDWHILKNIEQELNNTEPHVETLDTNFRSDMRIIKFNNAIFKNAAPLLDCEDEENGIVKEIFSDVQQKWPDDKKEEGFVRVMLKTDKVEDWEETMLSDLCNQIQSLIDAGVKKTDIAVLLRSRNHVGKLIDYVETHLENVKMVCDEGFKLGSSKALCMLIAALRVIWFGKQDEVAERYLIKEYMLNVSKPDAEIEEYTTADAKDVLPEEFTSRINELSVYPLNELCEELFRILSISSIKGEDAYVLTFFDELSAYLKNGITDIQSFLEFWEDDMRMKDIPACQIDGINIITIHKSKGLQYHTVLMPYCNEAMEEIRRTEMLWCDSKKAPFNTMGSLPINGDKTRFLHSDYADDYSNEQLLRRIDEFNSLYVAFTRAEHNLYVWGKCSNESLTYANLLNFTMRDENFDLPMEMKEEAGVTIWTYGEPFVCKKEKKEKKTADNRLSPDYVQEDIHFHSFNRKMDFRQSNEATQYIRMQGDDIEAAEGMEESMSYIEQGKLYHEIFSRIERAEQLDKILNEYADQGIIDRKKQLPRISKFIGKSLKNEVAARWFEGKTNVINECEIVHLDPETGKQVSHRPDRVMVSEDEITVVDFKFGKPKPEEYNAQVKGYMDLLHDMYPDRKVRGYLWYVYRNTIEEVDGNA